MNILIFKTVNKERFELLLEKIDALNNDVYIILPNDEIENYKDFGSKYHFIGTNKGYIDYDTLMQEMKIPNLMYHEVWVLTSSYEKMYSFYEAYTVISELKCFKLKYVVINKEEVLTYNLKREKIFSCTYSQKVKLIKRYMDLVYLFRKRYIW